jgi:membrane protease YdiL (CAAX protease family)
MSDRPQDRPEDRRRRGPLGDEENTEENRSAPRTGGPDGPNGEGAAARQGSTGDAGSGGARAADPEETAPRRTGEEVDPETRVIRTPGTSGAPEDEAMLYTREERLREVYGGVDWLGSFIGCIFAVVCGAVLLLLLSGIVLAPLSFTLDLQGQEIGTAAIVGLVIVGLSLFLAYFAGGYVAVRLVRFDGGRNGAATVVWSILLGVIFGVFSFLLAGFLPGGISESLESFRESSVLPSVNSLVELGLLGAGIAVGALLLMLLGGFLGGSLGTRYHTRIDQTT